MAVAVGKATAKIIDASLGASACFALDLPAEASAELVPGRGIRGRCPGYARDVAEKTLRLLGQKRGGLKIAVKSPIPEKAGLGAVEAVSCATALAVCGAVARRHGAVSELKIDKYVRHQFIVVGGRLVDRMRLIGLCPGEFDRLFASFYGGFVVSDNRKKEVLRRGEMESLSWVAAVPKKPRKQDPGYLSLFRHERDLIWQECVRGNLYGAMRLSALLYRDETASGMLSFGALAACTSFPSTVALVRDKKKMGAVAKAAKPSMVLSGFVANDESRVLVKPKKIVKTKEFLKMKGDMDYYFL